MKILMYRAQVVLAAGLSFACLVNGCATADSSPVVKSTPIAAAPPADGTPTDLPASHSSIHLFGQSPATADVPFAVASATALRQQTIADEGDDSDPNVDASGSRLVYASTRHAVVPQLYLQAIDGVAVTQLTSGPASDVQPAFSPDGRRVAFASDRSGNWDIWIIDIEDKTVTQVTRTNDPELHPTWSPSGDRLAYCRLNRNAQHWELWVSDANQATGGRFIGFGLYPAWSPNGDSIVYQRARERGSRWFSIWRIDLTADGEPRLPTEIASSASHALIQPAWSPDGRHVAYCSVNPDAVGDDVDMPRVSSPIDAASLWMIDADGRSPIQLTNGPGDDFGPAWGADGRIYFTSTRTGNETVWSLRPLATPDNDAANREVAVNNSIPSIAPR
jgi:Tol biopolymer transport system component